MIFMTTLVIMQASDSNDHDNPPKLRLLDEMRARIRVKHYSLRTEQSYTQWIKRFFYFHGKRHPAEMGAAEVEAFLSSLATDRHVLNKGGRGVTSPIDF